MPLTKIQMPVQMKISDAFLGIDTSNYTTSCALYCPDGGKMQFISRLLPVESGKRGLRQSDAVFHHTKQLYKVLEELDLTGIQVKKIGVSVTPTDADGSYMPCFLVGKSTAYALAKFLGVPVSEHSHQAGHIAAGIYSCGNDELFGEEFLAFHISGGTTDLLHVTPDEKNVLKIDRLATTLDATCGQIIDRVGVKMGLDFPCGKQLESLASEHDGIFKPRVYMKDGDCSFSGLENMCEKECKIGTVHSAARLCLDYIYTAIRDMTEYQIERTNIKKVLFVGGVMSDEIIRSRLENDFECYFAKKELSTDNAAGTAVLASRDRA